MRVMVLFPKMSFQRRVLTSEALHAVQNDSQQ